MLLVYRNEVMTPPAVEVEELILRINRRMEMTLITCFNIVAKEG